MSIFIPHISTSCCKSNVTSIGSCFGSRFILVRSYNIVGSIRRSARFRLDLPATQTPRHMGVSSFLVGLGRLFSFAPIQLGLVTEQFQLSQDSGPDPQTLSSIAITPCTYQSWCVFLNRGNDITLATPDSSASNSLQSRARFI